MVMRNQLCLLAALALAAAPGFAAEEEEEEEGPFSGTISFGFLGTSGNTETTSLDTKIGGEYVTGRWQHAAGGQAFTSSEDSETNAEYYTARWRTRWDLTPRDFLTFRLSWRKDRFGAFDTQFSQTLGYGRRVLDNEKHKLNLEAGAGLRQSEDQDGIDSDETVLSAGLDYTWNFSDTAKFQQVFLIEAGDENTYTESRTSVAARLIGELSLVASYVIRNNSDAPVGREKTDTQAAISLEYAF